jgi:dihydropteroate synthase
MPFSFSNLPRPAYLGILNITPNSFSDGNQFLDPAHAVAHAKELLAQGATILDLGAEASSFFCKGVTPTSPEEQLRRLLPVLDKLTKIPNVILSIDTRSAIVAAETLKRGAHIINDISAGTHDPDMLKTVAAHNAAIILMHIGPTYPENPKQDDPDILLTVEKYLAERIATAIAAGIPKEKIAIDPGLGFGKTPHDNWTLALNAHNLESNLQTPIVLGASRKRFLETPPPENLLPTKTWQSLLTSAAAKFSNLKSEISNPPHPRDFATFALTQLTQQNAIHLHRLHVIPPQQ